MKQILYFALIFISLKSTAQNVGIGTSSPVARLHVADSSVLFKSYQLWFLPSAIGNPPVSGEGTRMMWYAGKAAFRSGAVSGNVWDKDSVGKYSFAAGLDVKAKSDYSTAFGVNNNSLNWYTFTAGSVNTASGVGSVAMGVNNIARNSSSIAIGTNLITKAVNAITVGSTNDTSDAQLPEGSGAGTDRIFQIGNGVGSTRSNAQTTLRNGNTGMGVLNPLARLHVDSSVVFTSQAGVQVSAANPPVSGAGLRMMWYPDKAAFRAGYVDGNQWDKFNTGYYSFAAGQNSIASGNNAVSIGSSNTAIGQASVALGEFASSNQDRAVSIGYGVIAGGYASTALGFGAKAYGNYATAFGSNAVAYGGGAIAFGDNAIASADYSISAGAYTKSKSPYSFVIGYYNDSTNINRLFEIGNGTADNGRKNALTVLQNGNVGIGATNPSKLTEIIGAASSSPVTLVVGNRGAFGPAALEFVSDYGLANQWRPGYIKSNDIGSFTGALEFYTNGTSASNLYGNVKGLEVRNGVTYTATGSVSSWSDERLKLNIHPFTAGLDVISAINPVSFNYNDAAPFNTNKEQIGIVAQELEKIAPYMVEKTDTKDFQELRSVNNQAYTFLLINAIKELAEQNKRQQQEIEELKRLINK